MAEEHVPGMSMVAVRNLAKEGACSLGIRNGQGDPVTFDTLYECASLTKVFFAMLVMRFVDRGLLSLDTPLAPLLGGDPWSLSPAFQKITARHVLCHASGLPNWAPKPMDLLFEPGTAFSYSGEGYDLLQRVLEKLTGKTLDMLMNEEIFSFLPFIYHPSVVWTEAVGQVISEGFDTDGNVCKVRNARRTTGNGPEPNAAWSLYANAEIIAYLLREWICASSILRNRTLFDEMTRPQNPASHGVRWGLGIGLHESDPDLLWHWGDNRGFQSFLIADRRTGDSIVTCTNSDAGLHLVFRMLRILTDCACLDSIEAFIREAE